MNKITNALILQKVLNFTYVVKKPKDGAFGNILDNGNWTGMISELQTQEADIGKLFY